MRIRDCRGLHSGLLALAVLLLVGGAAQANPFETQLENGMKLIVKEDRRAPSVVHMVWYRAGSMDEEDGVSGVAHVLEHMMFKGTETLGPGEFNHRVAALGGRDNAFTGRDYTAYFQQIPPRGLDAVMALEADRMHRLDIQKEEFAKEIEVVKEERRLRTDDNPRALVFEQLMATVFQSHPYRRPIIGWMNDLDRMQAEDAREWYRRWYAPNHAVLVVVGDVDHREVFAQAALHYGPIPPNTSPAGREIVEPPPRGPRRAVVRAPAEQPYLALAWPVPTLRDIGSDRDVFALQVLAAILDGYEGARLPRNLVRGSRIAHAAGAGYGGMGRGPSLFYLTGSPAPGQPVEVLEQALREEVARIARDGVREEELQRVKVQAVAAEVFKRDSLMGQAMELGMLEMVGFSWRNEEHLLAALRSVTAEEVRAVAGRYFSDDALSAVVLEPQAPPEGGVPRARGFALRH